MEMKPRITKMNKLEAKKLLVLIPVVEGEKRTVNKCLDCGRLFGRRFIPFGIGYGASYNICTCQITSRRGSLLVLESAP
jgi:hypothetical protein